MQQIRTIHRLVGAHGTHKRNTISTEGMSTIQKNIQSEDSTLYNVVILMQIRLETTNTCIMHRA